MKVAEFPRIQPFLREPSKSKQGPFIANDERAFYDDQVLKAQACFFGREIEYSIVNVPIAIIPKAAQSGGEISCI